MFQTKPEMSPEKLQLLATVQVDGKYKQQWNMVEMVEQWLKWWNMSKDGRQAYNFPDSPCSTLALRLWVEIAAFWAGVIFSVFTNVFVVFRIRDTLSDELFWLLICL
jgi:hypothetical protein